MHIKCTEDIYWMDIYLIECSSAVSKLLRPAKGNFAASKARYIGLPSQISGVTDV